MKPTSTEPTIQIGTGENARIVTLGELVDTLTNRIDAASFTRQLRRAILETFMPQHMTPIARAVIAVKTTENELAFEFEQHAKDKLRITGVSITTFSKPINGQGTRWQMQYEPNAKGDRLEVKSNL